MSIRIATHQSPRTLSSATLNSMFRMRRQVFGERLGWAVPNVNGLERDEYDQQSPTYVIAENPAGDVTGCVRLLPTTGPYMLRDTFPQLLAGEQPPSAPDIWDVSRFAILSQHDAHQPWLSQHLVEAVIAHGCAQHYQAYVAVVSVALERIFRRMGLPTQRFGHGRAQRIGKVLSVALWIDTGPGALELLRTHTPMVGHA